MILSTGDVRGSRGHAWLWGDMCSWQGACVVVGEGRAWLWGACVVAGGCMVARGVLVSVKFGCFSPTRFSHFHCNAMRKAIKAHKNLHTK